MEHVQDSGAKQTKANSSSSSLTPHQLVQRHMANPDEPITDAEMENLNLEINNNSATENEISLTAAQKQSADELADAVQSDSADMSYKADL